MSDSDRAREPTWSGLLPGLPEILTGETGTAELAPVTAALADAGLRGRLLPLRFGSGPAFGMFRLERTHAPPLFVKRVPPERRDGIERAEAVACWLAASGVTVAVPLAGFPRPLADGGALVVMPYLDGVRIRPEPEPLAALGRAVAALHRALAEHPDRPSWAAASERRLWRLQAIREDLAAGRRAAGPDPVALAALAADPAVDFIMDYLARQPSHGDLNPGNVLLVDGAPVILDFEDVPHSVAPPVTELAVAVERFVLVPEPEHDRAVSLGRAFLGGYGRGTAAPVDPVGVLRARALRSLAILAEAEEAGTRISIAEWHKFFRLDAQARQRAATLRDIFAGDPA